MNHIESLKITFQRVLSKAECQAIIEAPKIACGLQYSYHRTPDGKCGPHRIISKFRGDKEIPVFFRYGATTKSIDVLSHLRQESPTNYLDALEAATEDDIREAARLAMKEMDDSDPLAQPNSQTVTSEEQSIAAILTQLRKHNIQFSVAIFQDKDRHGDFFLLRVYGLDSNKQEQEVCKQISAAVADLKKELKAEWQYSVWSGDSRLIGAYIPETASIRSQKS